MSGAPPKRLHEDSGHSTPTKRPLEDSNTFSSLSGKPVQPSGNDFHLLYESSQDVRLAKVPRIEHRDNDKRSSLLHRMPASSNNSSLDHSISPEIRSEFRNSKDARDVKNENREIKPEIRELNTDAKVDPQGSRGDNDVRIDGRGDEKQSRSDKGSHGAYRGDVKFEKDNCVVPSPHLNWKETKEPHKGKRYFEAPNDGLDSWRAARHAIQQTDEVMRDSSTVEERDSVEAHEAVGENRVDLKEEKFREKDRKRKDDKHRDVGERDKDKSDRRNTLPLVSPNNERKDPLREERELERWERDKRDLHRDKQRNERERDPIKMELNANEKECLHNDKEWVDESIKISEQENTTIEPTGPTDDSWKVCDSDSKERKNERDVDLGDRFEHHGRCNDKEPDDASTEGDGVTEKDREVFGSSVQHRRRMSRSRGTSQASHREPRFRSRARDNEGSQGQSDISAVVYKAGECMQELLRSWKELEASQDSKNDQIFQSYPTLEIRIPAEYVTATNHQVRGGQLWGTDLYTDDSDLVAVLMHTGYCRPTSSPPPSAIQELRATVRVLPPQDCYTSTLRNNVRSRAWGAGIGCSYRVERCCIVKKGGGTIDLEPHVNHISAVEPTLAPVFVERTMTTRAAASNALRQQRFVREVTIQYNLCNEPWLKYSISVVADKGLKKPLYTSARLKKGEVLYLETHFNRYELCFTGEKTVCNGTASTYSQAPESEQEKLQNHSSHVLAGDKNLTDRENIIDIFRWSRCKKALPQNVMRSIGIPLTLEHIEVLDENLAWEDVQWSQTGVWVSGKEYALARVHFLSRS